MEPSKIFGGTEECHSSESGWTMYIGSSDEDDGHSEADDAYAADNGGHGDETYANHEADSDDSLASDASSGPSHQGQFCNENMEGGHGTSNFKHDKDEEEGDCYLDKKGKKSVLGTKKKEGKEEKEQMTFRAKEASTPPSGSKVRKSIWLGKRK